MIIKSPKLDMMTGSASLITLFEKKREQPTAPMILVTPAATNPYIL